MRIIKSRPTLTKRPTPRLKTNTKEKASISESGTTLVEVMIATSVFSLVMVASMTTFAVMSRTYFKGLNESKTLNVALKIVDDVSSTIAATNSYVYKSGTDWKSHCFGGVKYSYKLNKVLTKNPVTGTEQSDKILVYSHDSGGGCQSPDPVQSTPVQSTATELLEERMRLLSFDITATGGLYEIEVVVAHGGDGDQQDCHVFVCDKNGDIDADGDDSTTADKGEYTCRINVSSCAIAKLSTKVYQGDN